MCYYNTSYSVTVITEDICAGAWENQQNDLCAQRRLRSAWASAQSDQSLCCQHEKNLGSLPTYWVHSEDWSLCCPHEINLGSLATHWQRRLIRLSGCPGWSESLLGAQVILLILPCAGSFLRKKLCRGLWHLLPGKRSRYQCTSEESVHQIWTL